LYDQAERAAGLQGVSVEEFVVGALEEKLRSGQSTNGKKQRIQLPLIPSSRPGTRPLSADRIAELLSEGDESH